MIKTLIVIIVAFFLALAAGFYAPLLIKNLNKKAKVDLRSGRMLDKYRSRPGQPKVSAQYSKMLSALNNAQATIEKITKELEGLKNEKELLRQANLNMHNGFLRATEEFADALKNLRRARQEVVNLELNRVLPLEKKIEELTKNNSAKEREFAQLQEEISKLQKEQLVLADVNKSLEKNFQEAEAQKLYLDKTATALQENISRQNLFIKTLQDNIDKLKGALAEKEKKIKSLELEFGRLNSFKELQEDKIVEQQDNINKLSSREKNLSVQISRINEELAKKDGLLVYKKEELAEAYKENKNLKEEINNLKLRLIGLEGEMSEAKEKQKAEELTANLGLFLKPERQ